MNTLLRIIVGEQERNFKSHNVYEWVKKFLWEKGFPGLTIRRSELSLDYQCRMHSFVIEDIAFNNLAIIMEAVADNSQIIKIRQELIENIPHGQISIVKGLEEDGRKMNNYFVVKVYTKECNLWFKKEEYEKVLNLFQKKKVMWATVSKGAVGYGRDRVVHKQGIFSFSGQMPIVIECIVSSQYLKDLLTELKVIVEEGVIFTTSANIIMNK